MSVKLIGIELEGGFDKGYDESDTSYHSDGSVDIDDEYCYCCNNECDHDNSNDCDCICGNSEHVRVGEYLSKPLPFDKIHEWINRNYPDEFNSSCGMHVHFSFKNDYEYSKFCSKAFYDYFMANIKEWADKNHVDKDSRFYHRLSGKNSYCKKDVNDMLIKSQLESFGDRYTILNYCHKKHHTIEIRLSHVWQNRDYAFMYIEACYDIFNRWLLQQKRSTRIKLEVFA